MRLLLEPVEPIEISSAIAQYRSDLDDDRLSAIIRRHVECWRQMHRVAISWPTSACDCVVC